MQILQFTSGLLLLAALSTGSAGPVYTWVDAVGVTFFSDTPPPDESISVRLIEDLPPPAAGRPVNEDFYSVVNQARRMESRRLLSEKLMAERLQAEADASRARAEALAAQQPVIVYENEPGGYLYPYYPRYRHHRPSGKHPGHPGRPVPDTSAITIKPPSLSAGLRILPDSRRYAHPENHRVRPH